ncbi:molybdopterin-binding protein [Natronincola ferrireducens]|uniref:Molybdopterin molybdenumtransferase n=1 Tax=Natronincola ferrireducens TaxID=393762 RepID=A0A1G9HCV9_9FIRM|nr:molybdopterin-binding protein [Natronincola ferrireducens]SDL10747.1 molybdenum cofactor cytidylyltransferase [Natronincola ferrireducens]
MRKVKVEDAIGMVLAHDLTKIVPGEFKGAAFKKGHIIGEEDILELKKMGKNHINILELREDDLHEDEAALRIAKAVTGGGFILEGPSEGKVNIKSSGRGLLKINVELLERIHEIDLIMLATLHSNTVIEEDKVVAGTRIIPLTIKKEAIEKVEAICKEVGKIITIKELKSLKIGILVTGSEVYEGTIVDRFGPVLKKKVEQYGGELLETKYAPDDVVKIEGAINELIDKGAEVILTSGGMSVDADDVTPSAIRNVADKVITYGSPVLPGAMFMLAYKGKATILGIPACGMYHRITVFDLVFPRVLAGEILTRKDISSLAHGGLCQNCKVCHYPICSLGR